MSAPSDTFSPVAKTLHWLMALLILGMLFVGLRMAATESPLYGPFVAWHRPIGIAILVLVAVRLAYRLVRPPPPLPDDLPSVQKLGATLSHWTLYALMFAMPLVGWAMLSAAREPVILFGPVVLPPIMPHSQMLYAGLRGLHTALAYLLILTFLAHLGAALFHWLVRRDGVFESMGFGRKPAG